MNAHRMDQETVERLLDGPVVDPQDGPRPLVLLLTAVRAAPRDDELAGEGAAVHAYRRALAGTPLDLPGRPPQRLTLTAFGVRALVAGIALAATGGVAFAAANGTLPNPLREPAPASAPPSTPSLPAASPGGSAGPSAPPSGPGGPDVAPTAALTGLCRSYREVADNPGRALDNPAFAPLVGAAGGKDRVDGYCDRALGGPPGQSRSPGAPTDRPGGAPGTRATDRPAPDTSPDGRPTVTGGDRAPAASPHRGLPPGHAAS
ncbi:hypothetical protein Q3W71_00115 [Micromonospora sp. C28SCA-DRY-2]|uniref:hypothetical protein n=1 Tax=Micromonospora sp. C28SCA-DRY-2 TaxID=3059522 RepID=UPI0026769B6A|nr:hypothetical protein [Micromonospora sp. C28SCA-DRY-2]MDO3700082.1 hypothetical protein [Micromonospora sp. C28SCA-DRY-2]